MPSLKKCSTSKKMLSTAPKQKTEPKPKTQKVKAEPKPKAPKVKPPPKTKVSNLIQENETETLIEGLELLKATLRNPQAQRGLVKLYSDSQTECTRNGGCGMEVGMSREKDQGAILKHFLGEKVNLDIDNNLTEDYIISGEKISAKHSGSKVGTPVKAKWTSADVSVKEAIRSMIEAPSQPHLLLTYLEPKLNKATIICVSAEHNKHVIQTLKDDVFKVPKGNSRGIEYSPKAMRALLEKRYFTIEIANSNLSGGSNPIERRIQMLKDMGINP